MNSHWPSIKYTFVLLIFSGILLSCKKKEDEPVPQPGSTFTAKVNGTAWSMAPNDGYFMSKYGSAHQFGGRNSLNAPFTTIALNFTCSPGTYLMSATGKFSANFGNSAGTLFTSRSGTISITQIDTVTSTHPQFLNKLKCAFSFTTDTIGGQSYNITEGMIDFVKP